MSRKTDDLQWQLDIMRGRIKDLEVQVELMRKKWAEFDDRVMGVMKGKAQVIVVDNLAAYRKGKKIKKDIDYISEVLGGEE